MTDTLRSNVYYLRLPEPASVPARLPSRPLALRRAVTGAWWRFRTAVADVWTVIRRPGRRAPAGEYRWVPERGAGERARPPLRSAASVPGRVIDFAAARLRHRSLPEA